MIKFGRILYFSHEWRGELWRWDVRHLSLMTGLVNDIHSLEGLQC